MPRGGEFLVQSPGFSHQASQVGPLGGRKVLKNLVSTFRSCCSWPFIIRKAAPWWHILFCYNAIFSLTNYIVSVARTSGSMLPKAGATACREVGCSKGPPPAQAPVKDLNQVWARVLDGTGHLAPVQVARWESFVVEMKGFLGTGVTCNKENLFPTLSQSRGGCPKPGGTEHEGQCAYSKALLTVAFNHLYKHLLNWITSFSAHSQGT